MRIAALGDSITYGYGVPRRDTWTAHLAKQRGVPVLNFGVSGDTTAGMLARFSAQVLPEKPDVLILMGGSNDIIMGLSEVQAAAMLKTIIYQALQAQMRVLLGMPFIPDASTLAFPGFTQAELPAFIQKRQALYDLMLDFSKLDYFTFFDTECAIQGDQSLFLDGLHLNAQGNRVLADYINQQF